MAKLSEILRERGYVYQHSSEKLEEITNGPKRTVYEGFDPSADSLHVGNLMGMLVLRRMLEAGHKVILVIGGGTGMIGDPSGKSEERVLLTAEQVMKNADAISEQARGLFETDNFKMVNNADWLGELKLIDFLRDIGKSFSVNAMLQRDSVRDRLDRDEQGISYTEFSYMLLQAYDFLHLNEKYGCDWQHGSSDQWGNIVSGIDLIRRHTGKTAYGTTHGLLINKSTGKKFGKTESGTIWLDPKKTSPYQFYQFWLNTDDEAVEEYLLKMTLLPKSEIDTAINAHVEDTSKRHAQITLATAVTTLVHGDEAAKSAQSISEVLFADKSLADIPASTAKALQKEAPSATIKLGLPIIDALIASKLATSKREARQFIEDGAVNLSSEQITDVTRVLEEEDFKNGIALLKRGKRNVSVLVLH